MPCKSRVVFLFLTALTSEINARTPESFNDTLKNPSDSFPQKTGTVLTVLIVLGVAAAVVVFLGCRSRCPRWNYTGTRWRHVYIDVGFYLAGGWGGGVAAFLPFFKLFQTSARSWFHLGLF